MNIGAERHDVIWQLDRRRSGYFGGFIRTPQGRYLSDAKECSSICFSQLFTDATFDNDNHSFMTPYLDAKSTSCAKGSQKINRPPLSPLATPSFLHPNLQGQELLGGGDGDGDIDSYWTGG